MDDWYQSDEQGQHATACQTRCSPHLSPFEYDPERYRKVLIKKKKIASDRLRPMYPICTFRPASVT